MELYLHDKMSNMITQRIENLEQQLLHGSVEDFDNYKELRARLSELATIKQELRLLLKKVEND
jgi:hypothetical protein